MSQSGAIYTSFVTAKLPRWAGVRQNVIGSNIEGMPIESPGSSSNGTASTAISKAGTISDQINQLAMLIDVLETRISALEESRQ